MIKIDREEYFEREGKTYIYFHRVFRSKMGGNPPSLDGWNRFSDCLGKKAIWLSSHEITE